MNARRLLTGHVLEIELTAQPTKVPGDRVRVPRFRAIESVGEKVRIGDDTLPDILGPSKYKTRPEIGGSPVIVRRRRSFGLGDSLSALRSFGTRPWLAFAACP